jgi:hypothetical protein
MTASAYRLQVGMKRHRSPMRAAAGASARWYRRIDARVSGCAFQTRTQATTMASVLEAIRVIAEPRNDQAAAIDPFQDGDDMKGKHADPPEHEEQAEHAADSHRA